MTQIASIPLAALTLLIALSGDAFAEVAAVPEPSTSALLIAGLGALVAVKYLTTKKVGVGSPVRRPARQPAPWTC